MGRLTSHHEPGERYALLRFVSVLFLMFGGVLCVVGTGLLAYGGYLLLSGSGAPTPTPASGATDALGSLAGPLATLRSPLGGLLWVVWGFSSLMSGLQSLALATVIRLAIHLEENTRASAQCLETLRLRTAPAEPEPGPLFVS
ncbi:MAG: hypothetical protein U0794_01810 [Isosphaeraceae bacterium]